MAGSPGAAGLTSTTDVRDVDVLREAFAAAKAAFVIHTAYRQHGPEAMAVNAEGARNVARVAREQGAYLIHVSSDVVFPGDGDRPLREDDEVRPVTAYGASKAAAERLVLAEHPDALIVRTSLILGGPGHAPSPHEQLAHAVARGESDVAFYTDEVRSPIQVDDLARAILWLSAGDWRGIMHLAGPDAVSRYELARLITGRDDLPHRSAPPDRPRYCPLDSSVALDLISPDAHPRGVRAVFAA
jgi:dTDP-4-dehydrorhamnose reductase